MAFRQLLSPTIERCILRFEGYRNKAVVVEALVKHSKLAESTIISKSIISEPEIEIKSDTTEEVSTPSCSELNEDVTELPKENVKLNHYIAVFERVVLLCKICEQQTSNRIESLAIESGCIRE